MEDIAKKAFIFYDIESTQKLVDGRLTHFPNLLVSEIFCDDCYDSDRKTKDNECETCGTFRTIYYDEDCVRKFVSKVLEDL